MLTFIRIFTPGRIRLILMAVRVYSRRQLIIMVVSNTWLAWRTYQQIQYELTKEVTFDLPELPENQAV